MSQAVLDKPKEERNSGMDPAIRVEKFNLFYGTFQALIDVDLELSPRKVSAIIGPSGCGKSTLLRAMNRMNDLIDNVRTSGQIYSHGRAIYGKDVDLIEHRKRVGMVFQRPNPFPLSVYENVIFGCRIHMKLSRPELDQRIENSLSSVGLWDTLKDKLNISALSLPGEQQQRLCIARLVAMNPEVLLMDEPCSALDPIATQRIEELIQELKRNYTIVIVTHNMAQAARVSDTTGFMLLGKLIEFGETKQIFTNPKEKLTEEYITGRFG